MEALIELVRSQPVLYDTGHDGYMKKTLKDEIWNRIAKDLKMKDGSAAKNAWLKLRKCHRDALKRKIQKSDSATAKTTRPWIYEKQLEFLLKFMASNFIQSLNIGNTTCPLEASAEMETEFETNVQASETSLGCEEEENSLLGLSMSDDEEREQRSSRRRKRKPDVNEMLIKTLERHEKRVSERETVNELKDDELFYFFMSMYSTTSKLPPLNQVKIKRAVFNAVTNEEEQVMSRHYSNSTAVQCCQPPN